MAGTLKEGFEFKGELLTIKRVKNEDRPILMELLSFKGMHYTFYYIKNVFIYGHFGETPKINFAFDKQELLSVYDGIEEPEQININKFDMFIAVEFTDSRSFESAYKEALGIVMQNGFEPIGFKFVCDVEMNGLEVEKFTMLIPVK